MITTSASIAMNRKTMLHIVSARSAGFWRTSLVAMSGDPAASIDASIVSMPLSSADNQSLALEAFGRVVESYDANLLFHLIMATEAKADWYQVLKVKNIAKSVINLVEFDENGYIIEDYNLQGLTITSKEISSLLNFLP